MKNELHILRFTFIITGQKKEREKNHETHGEQSKTLDLSLKINSFGKSQYVTGKKREKNRETQAVNIVQLSKWLRRFKLTCHTLMVHISPCFAWRWQPNILKSDNLQYNTVGRWVDGKTVPPSDAHSLARILNLANKVKLIGNLTSNFDTLYKAVCDDPMFILITWE